MKKWRWIGRWRALFGRSRTASQWSVGESSEADQQTWSGHQHQE
jgi:hypothetical protein